MAHVEDGTIKNVLIYSGFLLKTSGGGALHVLDFILLFCINNHCTDCIELIIYHYYVPIMLCNLFIYFFTFVLYFCMYYYM